MPLPEVTNAWFALEEALALCPTNHRARFLLVSCAMNADDYPRAKAEAGDCILLESHRLVKSPMP